MGTGGKDMGIQTTRAHTYLDAEKRVDRLARSVEALRFTARHSEHAWLRRLALVKYWEGAAAQKLASCGYRVRYDRTDSRSVW